MNPTLTKTYDAEAVANAHRIAKFGAADYGVVQADANTDNLIGVFDLGADAIGDRADVHRQGIVKVEYGGAVTRGDPLTSDADGRAVSAAGGVDQRIIGFAEVSGVLGDIGLVLIAPGAISGT